MGPADELERLYELTYKYQMLQQESALGDYGLAQPLPDAAYMELHRIEPELDERVSYGLKQMYTVYQDWIDNHWRLDKEAFTERLGNVIEDEDFWSGEAWNDLSQWVINRRLWKPLLRSMLFHAGATDETGKIANEEMLRLYPRLFLNNIFSLFTQGERDIHDPYRDEGDIDESTRDYLDVLSELTFKIKKDVVQELNNSPIPSLSDKFIKFINEEIDLVDELNLRIPPEDIYESFNQEFSGEEWDIAGEVFDAWQAREAVSNAVDTFDNAHTMWHTIAVTREAPLDEKITVFQQALTTAHTEGTMADHFLDVSDGEGAPILDRISAGPNVDAWDSELSRLLGYELGSRMQPEHDDWYSPQTGIARIVAAIAKFLGMRRTAEISTNELEDIYELTYKRQMLQQEQSMGDYGLPQTLPDPAYMEMSRLDPNLEALLDAAKDEMVETYDSWLKDHHDYAVRAMMESVVEQEMDWVRQMDLDDAERHFGADTVMEAIHNFASDEIYEAVKEEMSEEDGDAVIYKEPEEEPEVSFTDEWMKYLDKIKEKTGQKYQRELQFDEDWPEESEISDKTLHEVLKERVEKLTLNDDIIVDTFDRFSDDILSNLADEIDTDSDYIRERAEESAEEWLYDSAYPSVEEMKTRLEDEWDDDYDDEGLLNKKIILFQEALTTMHNNGEMADYLLQDSNAVQTLDDLSSGPDVDAWNSDLARLLGYEVGSRLVSDKPEYTSPLTGLAKVLAFLDELYEEEKSSGSDCMGS